MTQNELQPAYKRILLKLSGESLAPPQGLGIDPNAPNRSHSRYASCTISVCRSGS